MDKIAKKAPSIRSYKVQAPIVFAPNVQVTHLKSWTEKFGYYRAMMESLQQQKNVGQVIFMPNIVSPVATIEERAKQMAENLAQNRTLRNKEKVHLVTHSFAGIDARAAISMHGAHHDVKSLTTIATPHTGFRLINQIRNQPTMEQLKWLEKALGVVGLGSKNINEFAQRNIDDFNLVAEDQPGVDYFSFGTKKRELQISELLRHGYEVITEHKIQYECDGMVEVNECRWGEYMLTFDHDHFEVVGLNPSVKPNHVANLVTDNIRKSEIDSQLKKIKM